jgi:hypothetical protein
LEIRGGLLDYEGDGMTKTFPTFVGCAHQIFDPQLFVDSWKMSQFSDSDGTVEDTMKGANTDGPSMLWRNFFPLQRKASQKGIWVP